ncbi:MAG TPA: efflux RND transporter periplasmic adaptor subunit [Bacillota bacterium]|nr:efflux RND transporter periplasmic adaptor subunit [Bacillota bacterium]
MKKLMLVIGTVLCISLIIFVLFKNKAEIAAKAKIVPISSYPVSVVAVAREDVSESIAQVGEIVSNNDVAVVSEQSGKVLAVMVKEGSYVKAGSPLVKLDDVLPKAQYLTAQVSYEKAKKDWERAQNLRKQEIISDVELESSRLQYQSAEASYISAQKNYHNSLIVSPISGVVTSCPATVGTMVNPGKVVANVVDMSLFKLEVNIGEQDAFRLKAGDQVKITTDVYPGITFNGRIESVSAKSDTAHNYPVKIVIQNNNRQYPLKSGMYGKVNFDLRSQIALTIPRTALAGSIKQPQVFVAEGNKAKLRNIVVSGEVGTKLIVVDGLKEGDTIVSSGQENIKDNSTIEIIK